MVGLELNSFRTLRYCAWIISVLPKMEGLWVIWCVVRTSFSRATVCTLPCKQCWAKVKDQCNDIMNPEIANLRVQHGYAPSSTLPGDLSFRIPSPTSLHLSCPPISFWRCRSNLATDFEKCCACFKRQMFGARWLYLNIRLSIVSTGGQSLKMDMYAP